MKVKEIREFSQEEAEAKLREYQSELLNLRLRKQTGQIEKPHKMKELRRDIARIMTILGQKKEATQLA